jgi:hypothetical protein
MASPKFRLIKDNQSLSSTPMNIDERFNSVDERAHLEGGRDKGHN